VTACVSHPPSAPAIYEMIRAKESLE
jgi:hypothetical protein